MHKIKISSLKKIQYKEEYFKTFLENDQISIEFEYLSFFTNTNILRKCSYYICSIIGLGEKDISRIILIVDEMNNNAIEYGSKKGDINKFRFTIIKKIDNSFYLNLEVEDSGKSSKSKKALDMETLRAHQLKRGYGKHDSIRGRGLFMIIVSIVDRLYFKDKKGGGLIVGIKKNIKYS